MGFIVNEKVRVRLATLDIDIARNRVKIIGAYMPDISNSDEDAEMVSAQMDEQLWTAHAQRRRCIIGGDMNARVGMRCESYDQTILGIMCGTQGGSPSYNCVGCMRK